LRRRRAVEKLRFGMGCGEGHVEEMEKLRMFGIDVD
jgi:hypothetical protein